MKAKMATFRCMMCGYEYEELVHPGEDKERTCAKCRSNSIRHLRGKRSAAKGKQRAKAAK